MILLDKSTYQIGDHQITVQGLSADTLEKIEGICGIMDQKVKQKMLSMAADDDLIEAVRKQENSEKLLDNDLKALAKFNSDFKNYEFSIAECRTLLENYKQEIISVDGNDPSEFIDAVMQSPKYLKSIANLIFTEYREAIDIEAVKKI